MNTLRCWKPLSICAWHAPNNRKLRESGEARSTQGCQRIVLLHSFFPFTPAMVVSRAVLLLAATLAMACNVAYAIEAKCSACKLVAVSGERSAGRPLIC
eukprot:4678466-Pyramimonas_sp.AAC.2